jgi:hypothetical protein
VVSSCGKKYKNPHIEIQTRSGDIEVELFPENAPKSVAAFLSNIDSGYYKNASFYRALNDDNQPTGTREQHYSRVAFGRPKVCCTFPGSRMKIPGKPNLHILMARSRLRGQLREQQLLNFLSASAIKKVLIMAALTILTDKDMLLSDVL